jgi:hypothetical protein
MPLGLHAEAPERTPLTLRYIYHVLLELYTHDGPGFVTAWFREPVNGIQNLELLDYYHRVPKPMALRILLDGLVSGYYHDAAQVRKDLHQIVTNSTIYNGDSHAVTVQARLLVEYFERMVAPATVAEIEDFENLAQREGCNLDRVQQLVMSKAPSLLQGDDLLLDQCPSGLLRQLKAAL